jgi:hypothetical protein
VITGKNQKIRLIRATPTGLDGGWSAGSFYAISAKNASPETRRRQKKGAGEKSPAPGKTILEYPI